MGLWPNRGKLCDTYKKYVQKLVEMDQMIINEKLKKIYVQI